MWFLKIKYSYGLKESQPCTTLTFLNIQAVGWWCNLIISIWCQKSSALVFSNSTPHLELDWSYFSNNLKTMVEKIAGYVGEALFSQP